MYEIASTPAHSPAKVGIPSPTRLNDLAAATGAACIEVYRSAIITYSRQCHAATRPMSLTRVLRMVMTSTLT